jgi:hypothetical protein
MELHQQQLEQRAYQRGRLRGRQAVVRTNYFTEIGTGTKIILDKYVSDGDYYLARYGPGLQYSDAILPDEFNLIDMDYSGHKLLIRGIRAERKDKFGDNFCIELINNKRDIYISSALASLLNLNKDENYIGFAMNPDTKTMYIFNSDSVNGYLYNKTNGRITSPADWRELQAMFPTTVFEVIPQPLIDNDNPGFVFYGMNPDHNYYYEQTPEIAVKQPKVKNISKKGKSLADAMKEIYIEPPLSQKFYTYTDTLSDIAFKQPYSPEIGEITKIEQNKTDKLQDL